MKRIFTLLSASLLIMATCQKEDDVEPEAGPLLTTGFICTIGINSVDVEDTLALRASNTGTFTITDYSPTAVAGGFLVRPKDIWKLETSGDNNWYLKNNAGKYIDFSEDLVDPVNQNPDKHGYRYDLSDAPTEKSTYIRNQKDGQFYLESKYKRGFYLCTRAANVQPPDPSHRSVRFLPSKQMWFFMP